MHDPLTNLNTMWDIAIEYSDTFDTNDLFNILEAHLGDKLANNLMDLEPITSPCYAFIPCEECSYTKFCTFQRSPLDVRGKQSCQQTLKKFTSSFPSQST